MVLSPGSNAAPGQMIEPAVGSCTVAPVRVVVPTFCTRNDQVMVSPRSTFASPSTSATAADLVSRRAGACTIAVEVDDGFEAVVAPPGSTAEAVAVLSTSPASTSAWVTTCGSAAQVNDAPGGSRPGAQLTGPAVGSSTETECTVTVPVSCTRNVQLIWSPRSIRPSPSMSVAMADLVRCRPGSCCTAVSVELDEAVTTPPCGSRAVAVAVLETTPASTSA